MAIINCGECGASVSTEAKSCPGCGANRKVFRRPAGAKKPMSWPKKFGIAFGAMLGLGLIGQIAAGVSGTNPAVQTENAQDKQTKHRDYQAYLAAKTVKASLRNPDSLSFEQILANDDGSVICMTYRAQNGFGGMNIEHVVFKDGEPSQSQASWHARCAHKLLNDVTAVKSMI
jgi:rRNA maturation endonuclease Nob1